MHLVAVIPCHRRWDLLPSLLDALSPLPAIVVDDAPPGYRAPYPAAALQVVRTAGGVGFARAVNAGLRAAASAGFSHVLLLNDDALPEPGCVAALQAAWASGGVGAAGPVLLAPHGAVESAGMALSWWGRAQARRVQPAAAVVAVDALSGACLLVRSAVRLDEGYAHGFEDYALCRAIRQRGERVVVVTAARCRHLGGGTLSRTSQRAQRHAVSGHLRLLGRRRFVPVVVGLSAAQVVREGGPAARLWGVGEGLADWLRAEAAGPAGGAGWPPRGRDR